MHTSVALLVLLASRAGDACETHSECGRKKWCDDTNGCVACGEWSGKDLSASITGTVPLACAVPPPRPPRPPPPLPLPPPPSQPPNSQPPPCSHRLAGHRLAATALYRHPPPPVPVRPASYNRTQWKRLEEGTVVEQAGAKTEPGAASKAKPPPLAATIIATAVVSAAATAAVLMLSRRR